MNLTEELTLFLKKLQAQDKSLTVAWDAGGDETLLTFYVDGEIKDYRDDLLYRNLLDHMVMELELPNAGEYHSHGKGEIYLGYNDQVYIKYDEFAHEYTHEKVENFEERYQIKKETTFASQKSGIQYLDVMGLKKTSFNVTVTIFHERKVSFYEHVKFEPYRDQWSQEKITLRQELMDAVIAQLLSDLKEPSKGLLISFEMILTKAGSKVERIEVMRIIPDVDKQAVEMLLF